MARLFLALDISSADKEQISHWRQQHFSLPYRAIAPANFHITLCFLGNVEEQILQLIYESAEQLAKNHQLSSPASLSFNRCVRFTKADVIYLSSTHFPKWLSHLANGLCKKAIALDIFQEERPYVPHISIYRKAKNLPAKPHTQPVNITVKSFSLYQSFSTAKGAHYQAINKWYLYDNS